MTFFNEMNQLVSIIIPAYNAKKWIGDCIESAIAQQWPHKEIIVVDDGSKDATLKIAKRYESPIVKVVTKKNGGASAARNYGLSISHGDYIQWLDADDLLAPDKIAIQMMGAESGKSSLLLLSGAWGRFHHRLENTKFTPDSLWKNLQPVEWLYQKIVNNLWMAPISWLVSRKLTDMAGPWNENLSLDDDGEYFCRILSCSSGIRFFHESKSLKRQTFGLSNNFNIDNKKIESEFYALMFYIKTLRSMEDSPRTRDACLKLLKRWSIYFFPERLDLFRKMQSVTGDLGGKLEYPKLRPKYRWIKIIFGWRIAKKVQFTLPALRSIARKNLERLQF